MEIGLWNIQGLKNKLHIVQHVFPDVDSLLLCETWLSVDDKVSLPGYTIISQPRSFQHSAARRPSGGVAAFVKSNIAPLITLHPELSNESTLWIKYQDVIGTQPTFIGVCYAPPKSSSTYIHSSAIDPFDAMAVSFAALQGTGGRILFAGDLNARTGMLLDTEDPEEENEHALTAQGSIQALSTHKLRPRANMDKAINVFGRKLVRLCRETGMYILNGRVEGDLDGRHTCQGSSTVDYFITSSNSFAQARSLKVLSDIPDSDHSPVCLSWEMNHSPLEAKLIQREPHLSTKYKPCQPRIKKPSNVDQIENYCTAVKEALESGLNLDDNTTKLAEYLQTVIVNSASKAFGTKRLRTSSSFPVNTWYDNDCKTMHKKLQNALRTNDPNAKQYHKQYKSLIKAKKSQ